MSGMRPHNAGEQPAHSPSSTLSHDTFVSFMHRALTSPERLHKNAWETIANTALPAWNNVITDETLSIDHLNGALGSMLRTSDTLNTTSLVKSSGVSRQALYGLVLLEHTYGDPNESLPTGAPCNAVTPDSILVYARELGVTPSNHHQRAFHSLFGSLMRKRSTLPPQHPHTNGVIYDQASPAYPAFPSRCGLTQTAFHEAFYRADEMLASRLNIGIYYTVLKYCRAIRDRA